MPRDDWGQYRHVFELCFCSVMPYFPDKQQIKWKHAGDCNFLVYWFDDLGPAMVPVVCDRTPIGSPRRSSAETASLTMDQEALMGDPCSV